MNTTPEALARLTERLDNANANHAELKGMLTSISASQAQMATALAVFNSKLEQSDDHRARLFVLTDEHAKRLDSVESDVKVHSWTWKLMGSLAILGLSIGSYAVNEIRGMQDRGNAREKRLAILEFIVGGRQTFPQQPVPQGLTSK